MKLYNQIINPNLKRTQQTGNQTPIPQWKKICFRLTGLLKYLSTSISKARDKNYNYSVSQSNVNFLASNITFFIKLIHCFFYHNFQKTYNPISEWNKEFHNKAKLRASKACLGRRTTTLAVRT